MDNKGLYEKYRVERVDGKPIKWCFVLEPENDEAARDALWEYARRTPNIDLAKDICSSFFGGLRWRRKDDG